MKVMVVGSGESGSIQENIAGQDEERAMAKIGDPSHGRGWLILVMYWICRFPVAKPDRYY